MKNILELCIFTADIHLQSLTLNLIETPFNNYTNTADPDQAVLVRTA